MKTTLFQLFLQQSCLLPTYRQSGGFWNVYKHCNRKWIPIRWQSLHACLLMNPCYSVKWSKDTPGWVDDDRWNGLTSLVRRWIDVIFKHMSVYST